MLAVTGDVIILAISGLLTSLVTAGGAFYGIVYNARKQHRPRNVKVDPAELDRLEAELAHEHELRLLAELDAARWRNAVLGALSRDTPVDRPD